MSLPPEGYVGWPDAVPRDKVDRARQRIHESLGRYGLHPDRLLEYDQASYCPELRDHPDILALFKGTRLEEEAERRLGPLEPVDWAQIALRFPSDAPARAPHLDGIAAPLNGVEPGRIETFSALAGVYLSDVPEDGGALTVWPGSHVSNAAYFRAHGPEVLLERVPPVPGDGRTAIVGGPGYGFLVHYLVSHAVGVHHAPGIRYAVFFRLRARRHAERGHATMLDPTLEWPAADTAT